jgi:hypothetical protein
MTLGQMRDWLMLAPEEEGFEQEVLSSSHTGLPVAGGVEIFTALVFSAVHPFPRPNLLLAALGAATIACAHVNKAYEHGRLAALLSVFAGSALQAASMAVYGADDYALGGITVLLLTLVAAVPVRPVHALAVGSGTAAAYFGAALAAGAAARHVVFLVILALLATALAAVLYSQRPGDIPRISRCAAGVAGPEGHTGAASAGRERGDDGSPLGRPGA